MLSNILERGQSWQKATKKKQKKKERKKEKTNKDRKQQGETGAIVKGSELNDFVLNLS